MRLIALTVLLLASAAPAQAYMGPGAGLAFLGSLIALMAALGVGVLGLVWYPMKRLIKGKRAVHDEEQDPL